MVILFEKGCVMVKCGATVIPFPMLIQLQPLNRLSTKVVSFLFGALRQQHWYGTALWFSALTSFYRLLQGLLCSITSLLQPAWVQLLPKLETQAKK